MVEQFAAARRGPAFLNSFNETGVIFEQAVHRFDDELGSIAASTAGEVLKPSFLLWCKVNFHGLSFLR